MRKVDRPLARSKFKVQKHEAINKRNISFDITFEEWDAWWLSHGVDKNDRSCNPMGPDQLCMCRHKDLGPYALDNIFCGTRSENTRYACHQRKMEHNMKKVQTPTGEFESIIAACKYYKIHRSTFAKRSIKNPAEWHIKGN